MKKIICILFFFTPLLWRGGGAEVFSQSKFSLIKTIDVESDFFTSDNQSNVYVVKGNELTKFDKTGKELYKYSNKNFGNISFVDASNMLRVLVFYKDFLQVVLLDNTLSITGDPINLEKVGFQQTQLVCSSHNNGLWVYDQQNFELIRFDQGLVKTQQTGNLTAALNVDLQPNFILEYDNKVYLNNPTSGILMFDVYGTYYKTIPVKNAACFQPIGEWVYYMEKDKVKAYNVKSTEEKEFTMPQEKFDNFRLELGILMLRTEKSISLFSAE
jgi:hypothetical protein